MTKVKNTKTHTTGQHPKFCDVSVTDAKLVLVGQNQCDGCCAGKPIQDGMHRMSDGQYPDYMICKKSDYIKPILISETEKIEVDDWVLEYMMGKPYDVIQVTQEDLNRCKINFANRSCFKILALPEHFSPQQLQMIVDGKLKDGDKVLVECDIDETIPEPHNCEVIKLNPHITIYPVVRDLKFYENNAHDDFASTPISVLRYISELEKYLMDAIMDNEIMSKELLGVREKMYTSEEVKKLISKAFSSDLINSQSASELDKWFEQNVK